MYVSIGNWKVKLGKRYFILSSGRNKIEGIFESLQAAKDRAAELYFWQRLRVRMWSAVPEASRVTWVEKKRYRLEVQE